MALDRTQPPPKFNRANVADINSNDRRKGRKQDSDITASGGGNGGGGDNNGKFNRAPLTFPDPNVFNLVHELTENRDKYRATSRDDGVWLSLTSVPRYIRHSLTQILSTFIIKPPSLWTLYAACVDNGLRWIMDREEAKKLSALRKIWRTSDEAKYLDKTVTDIVGEMLDERKIETEGGSRQNVIVPYYIGETLNKASEALGFNPQGLAKIAIAVTLRTQTGDINEDYQDEMEKIVKEFVYSMELRARIGKVILDEFGVVEDD